MASLAGLGLGQRAAHRRLRGNGRFGDRARRPRAQVIGGLEPLLPGVHVHRGQGPDGGPGQEEIERLPLIDEGGTRGGEIDQGPHRQLPGGAVHPPENLRDLLDPLHGAIGEDDPFPHRRRPQPKPLELGHQLSIDLQELAGERLALEQIAQLWLDRLVAAGDRGDRGGGRDGDQQAVAKTMGGDARLEVVEALRALGPSAPQLMVESAARGTGLGESRMRTFLDGEVAGGIEGMVINLLGDPASEAQGLFAVEGQAQAEENVLQAHHPEADRPPAQIRAARASIG